MKKLCLLMLLCVMCFVIAACGGEEQPLFKSSDDALVLGEWGKNQKVSIEEREDGSLWVVNESGEDVLDVTEFAQTDILGDEFTGEPRLIKTYTSAGTKEMQVESDITEEMEYFTLNYYDTFGNLLVKDSSFDLMSISGNYGYTLSLDWNSPNCVFYLPSGECLTEEAPADAAYLTEDGLVIGTTDATSDAVFYDADGDLLTAIPGLYIKGFPSEYTFAEVWGEGWWGNYYNFCSVLESVGNASPYSSISGESETVSGQEYDDLVNGASPAPQKKGDLLLFSRSNDGYHGIVNEKGEILLEDEYLGFAFCGEDTIVAFGAEQTDLYSRADFSLIKSLPHKMTCYDGENSVLQVGEYSYYLADAEGNPLSEMNNGVKRVDMEDAGVRFFIDLPESMDVAVADRSGAVLYTLPYEPGVTYVGNGTLAIHSRAGQYLTDTNGVITKVIRLWDGYTYDESTNTIVENAQ